MRTFRITVDGVPYTVSVEDLDGVAPPDSRPSEPSPPRPGTVAPPVTPRPVPTAAEAAAPAGGPGEVLSPLAGTVVKVEVAVGQSVRQGDPVVTLEAMKMNTAIPATRSGQVKAVTVAAGAVVAEGQLLLTIG